MEIEWLIALATANGSVGEWAIKTEWLIRWLLQTVLWVSGAIKIEWLNPFGHRMLVNGFIRKSAISNAVEQIVPAGV